MNDPTVISQQAKVRHSIISKNGTLKYDFMMSLQQIAMASIVNSLWINQNTRQKIVNLYRHRKMLIWSVFEEIEDNIFAKISQLLLPDSIGQELRYLVSVLGKTIVNWILYHDEHILSPGESEYSAVDLIHNITWTARGKIDYVQTAKNILANTDICLSDDHKCILACTYCLENEILLLSSKLVNKFYTSRIVINKHPMVYLWTAHVTGDVIELQIEVDYRHRYRHYNAISINEHIIELLIKNDGTTSNKTINYVPISFMWNKLSKEEKAKNIALLFKIVDNPDFKISLLSNLDYGEQQNILREFSDVVLCAILEECWWWGKYFLPTALNDLDIIDPLAFWKVLLKINEKKRTSTQKKMYNHFKFLLKWFWQKSSTQIKEFIFYNNVQSLEGFVVYALDWEQDMDVIEVILKDLNTQQKRNIALNGNCCIILCSNYIRLDKLDIVDAFIKSTLISEEDIRQLKQRLIQDSGREIATSFLKQREFNKMQRFMNWAFKSEEEIANFRQSLDYTVPPVTQ